DSPDNMSRHYVQTAPMRWIDDFQSIHRRFALHKYRLSLTLRWPWIFLARNPDSDSPSEERQDRDRDTFAGVQAETWRCSASRPWKRNGRHRYSTSRRNRRRYRVGRAGEGQPPWAPRPPFGFPIGPSADPAAFLRGPDSAAKGLCSTPPKKNTSSCNHP